MVPNHQPDFILGRIWFNDQKSNKHGCCNRQRTWSSEIGKLWSRKQNGGYGDVSIPITYNVILGINFHVPAILGITRVPGHCHSPAKKRSEIYHHNFSRFRVKYETFPKLDALLSIKAGVQVPQIGFFFTGFNKSKIGRVSTNNGGTQKSSLHLEWFENGFEC